MIKVENVEAPKSSGFPKTPGIRYEIRWEGKPGCNTGGIMMMAAANRFTHYCEIYKRSKYIVFFGKEEYPGSYKEHRYY